ncbi:hypothetical protein M426DRAFT_263814, partial [Hypoxylon sp. CI-4A]
MSSSNIPVFDKLGDLRQKYLDDEWAQGVALMTQWPAKFKWNYLPGFTAHSKGLFNDVDVRNLQAVIVMLRHLLGFVTCSHRQIGEQNRLSGMLWADLEDEAGFAQQAQAQVAFLRWFQEQYSGRPITFENLVDNDHMWATFWNIPAFRLFHPVILAKTLAESEWHEARTDDPGLLVKRSMIEYQGQRDLGEHISERFRTVVDDDGIVRHRQSGDPSIIRVRYQHGCPDPPKTFQDLREIQVRPHQLREVDENGKISYKYDTSGGEPKTYLLVGVMRHGHVRNQSDLIRLYGIDGRYRRSAHVHTVNYTGIDWKLVGNVDDVYLLYYALAPPIRPDDESTAEVLPRPSGYRTKRLEAIASSTIKVSAAVGESSSGPVF